MANEKQNPLPAILSRKQTAIVIGRSLATVDQWARTGRLQRVIPAGRKRACGFRLVDIENLLQIKINFKGEQSR